MVEAFHKTCNIKHEIDIKRYGNAKKNPKQIAANASVSDYLFVFFLIFPENSAKICRIAKNERFTSVSPQ